MFLNGLVFAHRTLGFVNAPALFQRIVGDSLDAAVNTEEYQRRRDYLYSQLTELGYSCVKPQGAFYLFPRSFIPDDIEFTKRALKYNLLLVPAAALAAPAISESPIAWIFK